MPTIEEALQYARSELARNGITEPIRDAALLLALAIQRDKSFLIAHPEYLLTNGEAGRFETCVSRRSAHEPFQYISGKQEFFRLDFEVTPDVLIPRPETEMVVEAAIECLAEIEDPSFCEVGIGSGCIAISVLYEVPRATAVGLDISPPALRIAGRNAQRHGVADRLRLFESDVYSALEGERFELIAANPPYVPIDEFTGLQAEVRDFEPRIALTDETNGLSVIETIIRGAPPFLKSGGVLLLEIGFSQARAVRQMFTSEIWTNIDLMPDLQGIPRLVRAIAK